MLYNNGPKQRHTLGCERGRVDDGLKDLQAGRLDSNLAQDQRGGFLSKPALVFTAVGLCVTPHQLKMEKQGETFNGLEWGAGVYSHVFVFYLDRIGVFC